MIALDYRGGGVWTASAWVESESQPGKRYHTSVAVEVRDGKVHILKYSCECNDFVFRGLDRPCKHVQALVDHVRPQLEAQASWREKILKINEERKKKLEKAFEEVLKVIMLKIYIGGEELYCMPTTTSLFTSLWIKDGVASANIAFDCVNEIQEDDAEKIARVGERIAGFNIAGAEVEVYTVERKKPAGKRNPLKKMAASGGEQQ